MKKYLLWLCILFCSGKVLASPMPGLNNPFWLTDFTKAKLEAKESNKNILLNFSGSDWCTPCIRMHKTIFESSSFTAFADKELVLVNADFPRLSKHALSKEQQKQNDDLEEH